MTIAPPAPSLDELRARMRRMEGRSGAEPVATHSALTGLLQLQAGGTYVTESAALAGLLLAGPSAQGAWCGIVGTRTLGLEALAETGVDLSRCVLVPDPGTAWLEATAALVDVLGVVLVSAPHRVGESDAARLGARLRKRGVVLISLGAWPRPDATVRATDVRWAGLGQGHGHLQSRQVTVEVARGTAPARTRRLWFPDVEHRVRPVETHETPRTLRSVG